MNTVKDLEVAFQKLEESTLKIIHTTAIKKNTTQKTKQLIVKDILTHKKTLVLSLSSKSLRQLPDHVLWEMVSKFSLDNKNHMHRSVSVALISQLLKSVQKKIEGK
eukprot:Pgem_evm1s17091